jgi:hypothetical protein
MFSARARTMERLTGGARTGLKAPQVGLTHGLVLFLRAGPVEVIFHFSKLS